MYATMADCTEIPFYILPFTFYMLTFLLPPPSGLLNSNYRLG